VPIFSLKGERPGSPDTKTLLIMADISCKCLPTVSRAMIAVSGGGTRQLCTAVDGYRLQYRPSRRMAAQMSAHGVATSLLVRFDY